MPRIELINVTKKWGDFVAVDNLSMVIEDRAFVTLLGPSGCGKTTTLRMIAGLETPTEGRIIIGDRVVFCSEENINIPASRRNVGFIFQNYALWPHMTVYKNIAFGLENLKWKKPDIEKRVAEVLKTLHIEEYRDRYPSELSGGQQQRVAIARTLAPNPSVLFMDEPLSNLDAKLREQMRTELKRLHVDTDSTFIYVTHDQLEAMTLATEVCLIDRGLLQQYESPLQLYNYPANLFVASFVGNPTMNFIKATAKKQKDGNIELAFYNKKLLYKPIKAVEVPENVIIGVRPEFLQIVDKGALKGICYSTLPSGLETSIKVQIGDEILTLIEFGDVDYPLNTKLEINFRSEKILLFDAETEQFIVNGQIIN